MAIHKERGRWRVRYNGKHVGVYRLRAEAVKAEAAYIERRDEHPASRLTIADWREQWLAQVEAMGRKQSTIRTYQANTSKFAAEHGDRLLAEWTKADSATWGAKHPATVAGVGQMFRRAVDLEIIAKDPWKGIERPDYRRQFDPDWLTRDDLARLERVAAGDSTDDFGTFVSAMLTVAAWTALRPSEYWGIRRKDVAGSRLHIFTAIDQKTGARVQPKSKSGRRTVVLPPVAQAAIKRAEDASECLWPGRLQDEEATIFCNRRGDVWRGPAWQWHWRSIRERFGRPDMDVYELRHFGVTQLIEAGANYDDIKVQVGHANVNQLVRVYGHPNLEHARGRIDNAMAILARLSPAPEDAQIVDATDRFAQ